MEGSARELPSPPGAAFPSPWELLIGWHTHLYRHSTSAAPTAHMARGGCGEGAALHPGERPTGQPDPGCRWSRDLP